MSLSFLEPDRPDIRTVIQDALIFEGDIPNDLLGFIGGCDWVCWDIETTGLDWHKDRIGLCQLYTRGHAFLVQIGNTPPPNLIKLLGRKEVRKIFHYAPFDLRFMYRYWGAHAQNVACTKIASKILNPDVPNHSLKTLLKRHLNIDIAKTAIRKSNWVGSQLSAEQIGYAVSDVVYLQQLIKIFEHAMGPARWKLVEQCFQFLPTEAQLEIEGNHAVFAY